jgi:hypothetical protein
MTCPEAVVSVSQKAYETETTLALWAKSICKNLRFNQYKDKWGKRHRIIIE